MLVSALAGWEGVGCPRADWHLGVRTFLEYSSRYLDLSKRSTSGGGFDTADFFAAEVDAALEVLASALSASFANFSATLASSCSSSSGLGPAGTMGAAAAVDDEDDEEGLFAVCGVLGLELVGVTTIPTFLLLLLSHLAEEVILSNFLDLDLQSR